MPIWNPAQECASRTDIESLQLERLKNQVAYAYERIPWYQSQFRDQGVTPSDINVLSDISKLPFTDKTALRDNFPFGLFAVEMKDIVRLHSSSGTTGKPIVVGYTQDDLDIWTECIARLASMAGVTQVDRVQMCFLYGMFTGGWGLHYGLEHIGATVIPAGAGHTEKHLEMIQDYKSSVLVSTPSYAFYLGEKAAEIGYDIRSGSLRVALCGGEPCPAKLKKQIEENLGITVTNNYGLTELMGPGVSGECGCGDLLHINEDHFFAEIVNPDTGESLPMGSEGELVLTTLTRQGSPVLRFRTHDITYLTHEPCECGRTFVRMAPVRHRTDDMLIIKGVNIYPSQFEDILQHIEGASSQYQIIVTREGGSDKLEVKIEIDDELFVDSMAAMESLRRRINEKLNNALGIKITVSLVEPGHLERTQGKSKHVLDLRKD